MAEKTEIAWCDSTFNGWIGCTKVGPGCDNCYAEREFDHRHHRAKWGAGQERSRTSPANWKKPLRWNREPFWECACGYRSADPTQNGAIMLGGKPTCPQCLSTGLKQVRRRVFCSSLADLFDNEVPDSWRADLFGLIEQTPNLTWLLLTKRIGNVARMVPSRWMKYGAIRTGFPAHIWLGATVCNQEEADRDIPKLLQVPAAVRFVSMEPLLGPVDVSPYLHPKFRQSADQNWKDLHAPLDWVIAGGESGPKARPMHADWAYRLHDQCDAAGVPFLFKQWGEWVSPGARAFGTASGEVRHIRSDGSFWNEDDDALGDENADALTVVRVGKKAAGRDLHGELHNQYPEARP